MTPSILITRRFFPDMLEELNKYSNVVLWDHSAPPDKQWIIKNLSKVDGLITMLTDTIDEEIISIGASQGLKVISQMAVGFDNIDVKYATEQKIAVGNTPGVLTETTADFTWALLMALARQVVQSHEEVQQGVWRPWGPEVFAGIDINGSTLGIIGFGRIGQAVARRASGFGMKVLFFDPEGSRAKVNGIPGEPSNLEMLLCHSDFVSLHANLTASSRNLIGKRQLELMKSSAYLINTARGAMVDHNALYNALVKNQLAGAALDGFDPEPIPTDHPLLKLPNVIITPHIASASIATRRRMASMTIENAYAGVMGKKLPYCVNPEIYQT